MKWRVVQFQNYSHFSTLLMRLKYIWTKSEKLWAAPPPFDTLLTAGRDLMNMFSIESSINGIFYQKKQPGKLIPTAGRSDVLQQLSWPPATEQRQKNELNSRLWELIYPSEAFTALLLVATWNHEWSLKWILLVNATRKPSVSEIWCICLRSWLPAQIDRGRCFFFFFCKDDKMMSGKRSRAGETAFLHRCTFSASISAHLSLSSAVSLQ